MSSHMSMLIVLYSSLDKLAGALPKYKLYTAALEMQVIGRIKRCDHLSSLII